ncbi:MAG: B12-binding domain-containing radical SAM protein [Candidatus Omnitrophica bacterium]|nr:B12-binding domain-containing radical SAM protein [Candidatus Omnitrophota bacterium]
MRVAFIRPNMTAARSTDAMEPLAFAILAGLTPPEWETVLYDERLEDVPYDIPVDAVAITVETYTARRAYQIADRFREMGKPVIMGGYHPTFMPEEALEHADAVIIGDAEGVWEKVLDDVRDKTLRARYQQRFLPDLEKLLYDRTIFAGKRYVNVKPVQYSRGCRFACDFCSIHAFYGAHLRQRPVHEVAAEIASFRDKHIFIVDDNIFVDPDKAAELFRALIPLKIKWSCQVTIDIVKHPRLLKLMQQSGCEIVLIGFESLNEDNLRQMKKHWNVRQGGYAEGVRRLQDHGFMIYGTFVLGYDHDDTDAFDITVDFALRQNFCLANFNPLTPLPGTSLYDRLRTENRLLQERWWTDPGFHYGEATYHPKKMTPVELTEGCYRARTLFNRYRSIFKRLVDTPVNHRDLNRLGFYLTSNLISRREIHKKQGMSLGA